MSIAPPPSLSDIREWLRAQPSLTGVAPTLDLAELPEDPEPLFVDWIGEAAESGVAEPHTATLATVDGDGIPDARTLILKNIDAEGWSFAGARSSRKSQQIAARPAAALNFWWQPLRRAVRVRGMIREASPVESAADLAARSAEARGGIAPGEWVLWRIVATRVEFWQGSADRNHNRIIYRRAEGGWQRTVMGSITGVESDQIVDGRA
ncbi:pyridoxal 5'-phosphate synthase [Microbacterium oxydans]|uniref:pyridoxine/pyridoxamine 5'-phosphate oxidase n=1 Tax=Microbacterium oxydans TaxID=82380 RepID=UPI000F8F8D5C|nr:pyridoxamine 5'-phosphate oxidase family protein [Microbacterium oxydans]AZS47020.1 Pyridoxine/pyridoxamine 5'-phosphate oxidase [Microbacterium oxydans]